MNVGIDSVFGLRIERDQQIQKSEQGQDSQDDEATLAISTIWLGIWHGVVRTNNGLPCSHPLLGKKAIVMRAVETDQIRNNRVIASGAALGGLAVVFGAFGSHALASRLSGEELRWWQTAVQYQMWHALAVLGIGLSGLNWGRLPAVLLGAGAAIFSGTLYAMALGAPRLLGAVTPLGGIAMIAGWGLLTFRALAARR